MLRSTSHTLDTAAAVETQRLQCGYELLLEGRVARFGHDAYARLGVDGFDDVVWKRGGD